MLVVVASRYDLSARALVSQWSAQDTRLLTCADLSVTGWRHYTDGTLCSTAVIDGQVIAFEEISGILSRLPGVPEEELVSILPDERPYIAAEMTAYLYFWLATLKCPVLNRPTPTCLTGPYWRPERWMYAAGQLGMAIHPLRRQVLLSTYPAHVPASPSPVTVTVVGEKCLGAVDRALAHQARRLADVAQVDLLVVQFSGPEPDAFFLGAHLWPDVTVPEVADSILEYLQARRAT